MDGGFVVVPRPMANELAGRELEKPCYWATGVANVEPNHAIVQRGLLRLAWLLDSVSLTWASEARSLAARSKPQDLACKLQSTIKPLQKSCLHG